MDPLELLKRAGVALGQEVVRDYIGQDVLINGLAAALVAQVRAYEGQTPLPPAVFDAVALLEKAFRLGR